MVERTSGDERKKLLSPNGSTNWRTISIFFGIIISLLTILNYANGKVSAPTPDEHKSFITSAEYDGHVKWADERYEMLCKRLDEIAESQKEILKELRTVK